MKTEIASSVLLRAWCREGWKFRKIQDPDGTYRERIRRELKLIEEKDFADFFLCISDILRWAKNQGIAVGPARGSAAASLACFLLRITELDPLMYPAMLLERFLDPNRDDPPDIDTDVESGRRDEVRRYAERKYGAECVGNIAGFTRYRGKLALNDVARTLQIPQAEIAAVSELVAVRPDGDPRENLSLADALEFPAAKTVFGRHPGLHAAVRLEGNLRGLTVHAAGLVIASEPLDNFVASYTRDSGTGKGKRQLRVVSADMKDIAHLQALKLDLLGLTTMDILAGALRLAGLPLSTLSEIPDEDPAVMARFAAADTVGVFQFDGRATRNTCRAVRPQTFMELSDINALSRPGCLASGTTEAYIRAGRDIVALARRQLHPRVHEILSPTRGCLVYQEQLINVLRAAGGFDWDRASAVRKIVSKKIGGGALQKHRDDFIDGCVSIAMERDEAERLWHSMESSASYLFNTAHAVSYAKLAVWCQWMKVYHPAEFYCSALRHTPNDKQHEKALRTLLLDAEAHGVKIAAPDLEQSGVTWEIHHVIDDPHDLPVAVELLAGFSQIPGVGEATAEAIIAERNIRNFQNWDDLLRVKGIGPASLAKIKEFAGSGDPFAVHRAEHVVGEIIQLASSGQLAVPVPDVTSADLLARRVDPKRRITWAGLIRAREYHDALEDERARTGDDPDEIRSRLKSPNLLKYAVLKCYDHTSDEEVFVRVSRFDFPRTGRQVAAAEPGKDAIVVRGTAGSGLGAAIRADKIWVLEP
jgi:DNA polymerase-3 subunit alpha